MLKTKPLAVLTALALSLALTGCVGQDDGGGSGGDAKDPKDALTLAKKTLDETSGVKLELTSKDLPTSVSGIVLASASGTAMHPHSFQGSIVGSLSGITQDGQVIAIDGTVWAKIALLGDSFEKIDPASINAPDPGQLIADDGGLSDLLVMTDNPKKGESVRGGSNNSEVLTEYTGTLPGDEVTVLVPTAAGDTFDVVYQITDNGELRSMAITGEFYPNTSTMTYTVAFHDYDTLLDITAP